MGFVVRALLVGAVAVALPACAGPEPPAEREAESEALEVYAASVHCGAYQGRTTEERDSFTRHVERYERNGVTRFETGISFANRGVPGIAADQQFTVELSLNAHTQRASNRARGDARSSTTLWSAKCQERPAARVNERSLVAPSLFSEALDGHHANAWEITMKTVSLSAGADSPNGELPPPSDDHASVRFEALDLDHATFVR